MGTLSRYIYSCTGRREWYQILHVHVYPVLVHQVLEPVVTLSQRQQQRIITITALNSYRMRAITWQDAINPWQVFLRFLGLEITF